jgi:hypothetical protein
VILPPLSPSLRIYRKAGKPEFPAGGTATGFMTNGAHITHAKGGFSARMRARANAKPRPSLGSSHALLLLSCP